MRLAGHFAIAARLYAEAVVAFTQNGVASMDQYQQLHEITVAAQRRCAAACAAFEEHVDVHRCSNSRWGHQAHPAFG